MWQPVSVNLRFTGSFLTRDSTSTEAGDAVRSKGLRRYVCVEQPHRLFGREVTSCHGTWLLDVVL